MFVVNFIYLFVPKIFLHLPFLITFIILSFVLFAKSEMDLLMHKQNYKRQRWLFFPDWRKTHTDICNVYVYVTLCNLDMYILRYICTLYNSFSYLLTFLFCSCVAAAVTFWKYICGFSHTYKCCTCICPHTYDTYVQCLLGVALVPGCRTHFCFSVFGWKNRFESEIFIECTGTCHGEWVACHDFKWPLIWGGNLLSIHIVAHMVGQSFGVETSRVPPSMLCSFSMSRVSFHVKTLM